MPSSMGEMAAMANGPGAAGPGFLPQQKVRVFWPVDNSWYIGTVQQYNAATGEHLLKYEDGDTEWVQLGESNTTMNPSDFRQPNQTQPGMIPPQSSPVDTKSAMAPSATVSADGTAESKAPDTSQSTAVSNGTTTAAVSGPQSANVPASAPPIGVEGAANPLHPSYRPPYGAGPPGSAYQPPSAQGQQHHLPPHLSHHPPHHGYNHGPGAPPPSSMYGGPGGYPHGHAPPMPGGYGYPGHAGMSIPERHGPGGPAVRHPYGGPGHPSYPHRLENPPSSNPTPGSSGANTSGNGKRKTGPKAWTKEEDALLLSIVQSMRIPMKWSLVAQNLPERTGKQCRERYVNHLNPRLKVTDWSPTEDATIFHLYNTIGSHWAKMSKIIPGRTDNGIKNRFHNLRRQLEREEEHRLRLNASRDFPEEIRLELIREFPKEMRGKTAELWDIKSGLSVLAAQSVLGGDRTRTAGRFGPFREAVSGEDICARCGFMLPSVQTGSQICTKTGWCQSCARIPPHVSGNMLRECLNLRRCQNADQRKIIESWGLPWEKPSEDKKEE